jgi:hypothetical protein
MKRVTFVVVVVIAGLAVAAGFATSKASAAPSCHAYVQTQSGRYEGVVDTNYRTSCPFARNVAAASLRQITAAGGRFHGTFTTSAYSPVTGMWYRARCSAYGDLYNGAMNVDCRAGIGARVVYRAWTY